MQEKSRMINRNEFNLSHTVLQTTKFGRLLPFLVQEIIPGDSMEIDVNSLVRFQPLLAPAMSDIYGKMELFFVPTRLVHEKFEDFITGGEDGDDKTIVPYFDFSDTEKFPNGTEQGTLFDYLGLGTGYKGKISSYVVRAINMIWNEWYRDQNIQPKRANVKTSGDVGSDNNTVDFSIPFRNFEKDYYTCSFPYAQKGPAVMLPLGNTAKVLTVDNTPTELNWGLAPNQAQHGHLDINIADNRMVGISATDPTNNTNLYVDLTEAVSASVDTVRKAFQIQKFQFLNLRGGSRYVEYIYNFYGIRSSDARVQRPELIASSTFNVMVNEVLQTSENTSQSTPTATMYGHGIASGSSGIIQKSFEEFGYLIGLYSIQPKTSYMQMIERHWTRFSKYDYYNPCFAFLGYQAITNKEIYSKSAKPDEIFSFQGMYDELRHRQSYVCGDFKGNLKYWHLSREFDSQPLLNSSFINAENSSDRIFADTEDDYILCEFYNRIKAFRALPVHSDPGLIDHVYY